MQEGYLKNFSYVFIPFSLEKVEEFPEFYKSVAASGGWQQVDDEIRYLHRYVSDKLIGSVGDVTNSVRFRLNEDYAKKQGLQLGGEWYSTEPKDFGGEADVCFKFLISDVQLFAFNTSICILAYKLHFEEDDPLKIATAQYHLRKISTEKIHLAHGDRQGGYESFVDISKKLLGQQLDKFMADFFFYAVPKTERANFLTFVDVEDKDNHDKELFYLKWCYHDHFDYDVGSFDDGSENYVVNTDVVWGVSASAAVCLVARNDKNKSFIENVFQKNFQNQYLMTYILLLHQKYMMYLFLTKTSVGIDGNLTELEKYKRRLYEFETHYMFSQISEVPQYQVFYEKVKKVFSLDDMFHDVQEPLAQLAEIQKQASEKKQREYDSRINTALTTLSLLTVISAITDATGVTANLGWLVSPLISKIVQIIALVSVAVLSVCMIWRLISLKNKR